MGKRLRVEQMTPCDLIDGILGRRFERISPWRERSQGRLSSAESKIERVQLGSKYEVREDLIEEIVTFDNIRIALSDRCGNSPEDFRLGQLASIERLFPSCIVGQCGCEYSVFGFAGIAPHTGLRMCRDSDLNSAKFVEGHLLEQRDTRLEEILRQRIRLQKERVDLGVVTCPFQRRAVVGLHDKPDSLPQIIPSLEGHKETIEV